MYVEFHRYTVLNEYASAKISSRNHDSSSTVSELLEILFQTFVSFDVVELFFKCSSTNLGLYQSCSKIVVPDICSFTVVKRLLKCCYTNLEYQSCSEMLVLEQC